MNAKENREYYLKNKEWIKSRRRDRDKGNKEKRSKQYKSYALRKKYGLTIEQFEQMKTAQQNRCAICGNIFKNSLDTNIDHDHETGKTRQLLCSKCNFALGMLDENYEKTIKLSNYIRKWKQ
jgi:hypothetical protein